MAWHTPQTPNENGCREWTGRCVDGYGIISVADDQNRWIPRAAHRIAWALANPDQPLPQVVRHTCDNPPCVEPTHLLPGTPQDNAQDCSDRGRRLYGDAHAKTRISDADVTALRAAYAEGASRADLRAQFAISKSQVQRIVNGTARTGPPPANPGAHR